MVREQLVSLLLFLLLAQFRKCYGIESEAVKTGGQVTVGQPPPLPRPSIVQKVKRNWKRGHTAWRFGNIGPLSRRVQEFLWIWKRERKDWRLGSSWSAFSPSSA
jgi:hypothetical protein